GNTGHVLLVAARPRPRTASRPLVKGTRQWEVSVIDQSSSGHGDSDTRRKASGGFSGGLGKGVFRLYSNADDEVVGWSWSTSPQSTPYTQAQRPLAIGRLDLKSG